MTFKYAKTIADIIHEHKAREAELDANAQPAFDTTTDDDRGWHEQYKPSTQRLGEYISKKH